MKSVIVLLAQIFLLSGLIAGQGSVKIKGGVDPVFPTEASSYIYGDTIKVAVEVDKQGTVTRAVALGPLVPCADKKDKISDVIRKAAVDAAKSTIVEPRIANGEPTVFSLIITYPLTEKKIRVEDPSKPSTSRATLLPKPVITPEARAIRISGTVELQVLIDETGRVISFAPLSGHPALVAGTIASACSARFKPETTDGQAVKILGKITYHFVQ